MDYLTIMLDPYKRAASGRLSQAKLYIGSMQVLAHGKVQAHADRVLPVQVHAERGREIHGSTCSRSNECLEFVDAQG